MVKFLPVSVLRLCLLLGVFCFIKAVPAYAEGADRDLGMQVPSIDVAVLEKLKLSDADAALYTKIFRAQARNDNQAAQALAQKLTDKSLVDWARVQRGASLWVPQNVGPALARIYTSPLPRDKKAAQGAKDIAISVSVLLKTDEITRAIAVIKRAAVLGTIDRIEAAQLYAQTASAYLYDGQTTEALRLAHLALQIGGTKVPQGAWVAGLASWMQDKPDKAAQYFAWVPRSVYAGPWMRSAAAYWTARAHMRQGQYSHVSAWLSEAAKNPRSFYGLIATRALGTRFDFNFSAPIFTKAHLDILTKHKGAVRALKLAQAGQMDMARIELALLDSAEAPLWREALAALANSVLKPDTAMAVASILAAPNGGPPDLAMYPVAPWEPQGGYRLDPALIHAFMRQESGFKPSVTNKTSGATGLLQLMPRTASAINKNYSGDALKNPRVSLEAGQTYLEKLLQQNNGHLFDAAIAYNAGPGNLSAWKERFATVDDPLLFIELIPFAETRAYVERVMANYWIYSLRMGYGVASLDAVAAGKPAVYASFINKRDSAVYAALSANTR